MRRPPTLAPALALALALALVDAQSQRSFHAAFTRFRPLSARFCARQKNTRSASRLANRVLLINDARCCCSRSRLLQQSSLIARARADPKKKVHVVWHFLFLLICFRRCKRSNTHEQKFFEFFTLTNARALQTFLSSRFFNEQKHS